MNNPSKTAIDELYLWIEHSGMPITPDGCFLAFKKVQDDYRSYNVGANGEVFWNRIGDVVSMPREQVNPDRHNTCSAGLHFCAHSYLPSYYGNQGKVIIVKIDPADVVAIPSDYNNAKGRAWRYEVIGEVPESEAAFAFQSSVVESFGTYSDDNQTDTPCDCDICVAAADEVEVAAQHDEHDTDCACVSCQCDRDDACTNQIDCLCDACIAETPVEDDEDEVFTTTDGREFTATEIKLAVHNHGQRGASRNLIIPRTTLQDWLAHLR